MMHFAAGQRIGPYEIVSPLGEGRMGEVYRARETMLDRDVALKVLPESFASDPDRLMRFEREAKTLAALSAGFRAGQDRGPEGPRYVRRCSAEL